MYYSEQPAGGGYTVSPTLEAKKPAVAAKTVGRSCARHRALTSRGLKRAAVADRTLAGPADQPDVLVALNPAALRANIRDVRPSGMVIVNSDAFNTKSLKLAGYDHDPLPALRSRYQLVEIPLTRLNRDALADLAAATAMPVRVRDDMNAAVDMINRLEVMRKQLQDQEAAHAKDTKLLRSLAALDATALDVELRLLSRTDLHSDDKWYVEPYKVYMNLIWLSGEVGSGAGDVAGGADYRPTDASAAVLTQIEGDLAAAKVAFTTLVDKDVPAFNKAMKGKVPAIADKE